MDSVTELESIRISDMSDIVFAGRKTKAILADAAVDDTTVEEIVLVVHELASNIVKHADEGSITFTSCSAHDRNGIEIQADDSGPGIDDIEEALADGYSTAGTLGNGLGTVHRLMDDVVIKSDTDSGSQITATRWSERHVPIVTDPPLSAGAATRPKPGGECNGDAFLIEHGQAETLVGVIDGLGHGEHAKRAAVQARQYVQSHSDQSLSKIFSGAEHACRSTRGVVMALARFDWAADTVTIGGVGNITVKGRLASEPHTIVTPRGVVGANAPRPTLTENEWRPGDALVLHSDGIASDWNWDVLTDLQEVPVARTSRELLHSHGQHDDDATILVVQGTEQ